MAIAVGDDRLVGVDPLDWSHDQMIRAIDATENDRPELDVLIVGGGFSGCALALHLADIAVPRPLRIAVVERSGDFGPGLAYGNVPKVCLLNVCAQRLGIRENDL